MEVRSKEKKKVGGRETRFKRLRPKSQQVHNFFFFLAGCVAKIGQPRKIFFAAPPLGVSRLISFIMAR